MKENIFKKPQVYIILFTVLNLFKIILNTDIGSLTLIGALSKLLTLAAPLSILIYFIAEKKELPFKKYVLPIGFGLTSITVFIAGWQAAALSVYDEVFGAVSIIMIAIQALAMILMFVGTLFDFESVGCLKFGSLLFIAASVISFVTGAVFDKLNGGYGFNPIPLINFFITCLFYFGIYLLAKEKSK